MAKKAKANDNYSEYMRCEGGMICPFVQESYDKEPRLVRCDANGRYTEKPRIGSDIIEASGFPMAEA